MTLYQHHQGTTTAVKLSRYICCCNSTHKERYSSSSSSAIVVYYLESVCMRRTHGKGRVDPPPPLLFACLLLLLLLCALPHLARGGFLSTLHLAAVSSSAPSFKSHSGRLLVSIPWWSGRRCLGGRRRDRNTRRVCFGSGWARHCRLQFDGSKVERTERKYGQLLLLYT